MLEVWNGEDTVKEKWKQIVVAAMGLKGL